VTGNFYTVPIGEMAINDTPDDVLVAYGLGSCVAVCLYDPVARVGGMLHALLPTANGNRRRGKRTKYVDQGTELLVNTLLKWGAKRNRLQAYLCGGAEVLSAPGLDKILTIGEDNVRSAEAALRSAGLTIRAQDTGKNAGRTVKLYAATGKVTVKTLDQVEQTLSIKRQRRTQNTPLEGPYA
jgi:chemotaxis protein CheD